MKSAWLMAIVVLAPMAAWPGIGPSAVTSVGPTTPSQTPPAAPERPVITLPTPTTLPVVRTTIQVKTAEEFVKALGSDRIIELTDDSYDLSVAKRGIGEHFKWSQTANEQYQLTIRDVANLTIRGTRRQPAHVAVVDPYATVLTFEGCRNLELDNLRIGHTVEKGVCIGGVLAARGVEGLTISGSTLYGCGTDGLTLEKVKGLRFIESIIEECTQAVLHAEDCRDLRFEKSTFRKCTYSGLNFVDCAGVAFVDCHIAQIATGGGNLFHTNLSDKDFAMSFKGGSIKGNSADRLIQLPEMLVIEGAIVEDNAWQATDAMKQRRGARQPLVTGGFTYVTTTDDMWWRFLSHKLYGDVEHVSVLKAANPNIDEPLMADLTIICPR